MKNRPRLCILFLTAAVAAAAAFNAGLPAKASTSNIPDPRVSLKEGATAPVNVGVGSLFDLDLTFTHTFDTRNSDETYSKICNSFSDTSDIYAVIDVTSETGSVLAGRTEYKVNAACNTEDYQKEITYDLYIPQKELKRTGSGYGVLKFTITYYEDAKKENRIKDSDKQNVPAFTVEYQAFPRLAGTSSGNEGEGRLSVESYRLDHTPVREGEKFSVTLSVKNDGSIPCDNVTAVLGLAENSGLSIDGVTDTQNIAQLAAGAAVQITYPMACQAKMTTGNYAAGITLSCDECAPTVSKIYIPVTGTKDDTSSVGESKPQIIIESYDYGGKAVTGGQEFNLIMNIRNTGTIAIENCKITVGSAADNTASTSEGSVFTPAKSSNTFFISKLVSGATVKEEIALLPKSDAAPNSYGVNVSFKYDAVVDGKRQSLDASETITVPLTQPDRFEVSEPELDEEMFAGQPGQLNIEYVNKGKSGIYNLAVKLAGNFTTKDGSSNIGNLESGASDTYQASITPSGEGTLKGTATFSYEDSTGKIKTIVKDFSCAVGTAADETAAQGSGMPETGNMQKSGPAWWIWPAAVGFAVVAAVAVKILLKKHKAKERRLLEESDDDSDISAGGNEK